MSQEILRSHSVPNARNEFNCIAVTKLLVMVTKLKWRNELRASYSAVTPKLRTFSSGRRKHLIFESLHTCHVRHACKGLPTPGLANSNVTLCILKLGHDENISIFSIRMTSRQLRINLWYRYCFNITWNRNANMSYRFVSNAPSGTRIRLVLGWILIRSSVFSKVISVLREMRFKSPNHRLIWSFAMWIPLHWT